VALRGRGRRPDYRPLLAALDIPALVVAGTADPWSNAEVTAEIVSSLKRPELVVIDGSGHLLNLEAEAQFNEALGTPPPRSSRTRGGAPLRAGCAPAGRRRRGGRRGRARA
jgi:alpha-beta hydrolase superfamily lysophospholipase